VQLARMRWPRFAGALILGCGLVAWSVVTVANASGTEPNLGLIVWASVALLAASIGLRAATVIAPRLLLPSVIGLCISGGVLAVTPFRAPALIAGVIAVISIAAEASLPVSLSVCLIGPVCATVAAIATHAPLDSWISACLVFVASLAPGFARRSSRMRAEQVQLTLVQERRAAEAERSAAAAAERARIARETHDVLAHSLSALSLTLNAAEGFLLSTPMEPGTTRALECVRRAKKLTTEAGTETRTVIRTLRDQQPLVHRLHELIRSDHTGGSSSVRLKVIGLESELPAPMEHALYRAVQESITNVRKHAPGSSAEISLEYADDDVSVTVRNRATGHRSASLSTASTSGFGLIGLAERARELGGTFDYGTSDGFWETQMRLPR
jgi:signal transduction histidine kinase